MRLKNKVSIITGSARGIGQATAFKFAREGGKVVVCDLTPELIEETVAAIRTAGGEAIGCIDEQFDLVIDINLKGVYNCTRAVVDTMLQQQSGVILSSSSIVGLYGNFGQTNYAATKGAVISMTKTWAKELGRKGIRANAVCPGFVGTTILNSMPERVLRAMEEKVPLGRLGKPEEIADSFAFLASDEASYINGIVLEVGGGVTL
ncbi:MAG: SDR family oxidoreductase [Proteobacteria bacterium]|nr:SDR family oxidoreductase [Pseudomonadota bacterium]